MGKITLSMATFNKYVKLPEGIVHRDSFVGSGIENKQVVPQKM